MKVCFWSTTFQADNQALAYHLAQDPAFEVLVAMDRPELYSGEAIQRVLPFRGRLLDRNDKRAEQELKRFGADLLIVDNHVPPFRIAPRVLVLWHGFGWRVDDLSQMRRALKKQVGDVSRPNPKFRWQAFGDWDMRYRIEHSELAAPNVVPLGSAYSDWLLPDSPVRSRLARAAVQPYYRIDLERPTALIALTWHHGGSLGHWGDEAQLLDRLLTHIEARGANALLRLHDRHRYEPAYAEMIELLVRHRPHAQLKWKSSAPDSFVDLAISDLMLSNYSSILNGFYHSGRPSLHIDPGGDPSAPQYYRRIKSGRLRIKRVEDPKQLWKLQPDEHGGLRARSFDELLAQVDQAIADPNCSRENARAFCARYITRADGETSARIAAYLRSWVDGT